jgi:hypothetical protein
MPDTVSHLAGYGGVALYLSSYALLQSGVLRGSGTVYTVMNLAAALLVLVSLSRDFNLSAALIQVFWVTISCVGLARQAILSRSVTLSGEEAALAATALPSLSRLQARRFLDTGTWVNLPSGTVLTTEAEPVRALTYLSEAEATVGCGGQEIARITNGFVGEINVLGEGPASATVRIAQAGRVFMVSADALRALLVRDSELKALVLGDLRHDTGRKLHAQNRGSAKPQP